MWDSLIFSVLKLLENKEVIADNQISDENLGLCNSILKVNY